MDEGIQFQSDRRPWVAATERQPLGNQRVLVKHSLALINKASLSLRLNQRYKTETIVFATIVDFVY